MLSFFCNLWLTANLIKVYIKFVVTSIFFDELILPWGIIKVILVKLSKEK